MTLDILDKIAAEYGFKLCDSITEHKELEKEINKALGILIEDGPFAFSIWLESENKESHKAIIFRSLEILKDKNIFLTDGSKKLRDVLLEDIASDLNKLILTKQVLERMLVYARYGAKAKQKELKKK